MGVINQLIARGPHLVRDRSDGYFQQIGFTKLQIEAMTHFRGFVPVLGVPPLSPGVYQW